jgi:hypothetical protein
MERKGGSVTVAILPLGRLNMGSPIAPRPPISITMQAVFVSTEECRKVQRQAKKPSAAWNKKDRYSFGE